MITYSKKILTPDFFDRPVLTVAPELLGKYLVVRHNGRQRALMITEVEAYDGECDLANHASRGRTTRTEVMYGEAGHFYVYLCYGMHWMLNVVTGAKGYPAAVLIRGLESLSGPGRLTKELGLNGRIHNRPASRATGLWFEDRGVRPSKISKLPRVGLSRQIGPIWAKKPWRFVIKSRPASPNPRGPRNRARR